MNAKQYSALLVQRDARIAELEADKKAAREDAQHARNERDELLKIMRRGGCRDCDDYAAKIAELKAEVTRLSTSLAETTEKRVGWANDVARLIDANLQQAKALTSAERALVAQRTEIDKLSRVYQAATRSVRHE